MTTLLHDECTMSRQQEILRQVVMLCLIGFGLLGIASYAPDASGRPELFFQAALNASWQKPFEWPAVWSSLKIILFGAGLFLVFESLGSVLMVMKLRRLALLVYFLHMLPSFALISGGYYLVKAFF